MCDAELRSGKTNFCTPLCKEVYVRRLPFEDKSSAVKNLGKEHFSKIVLNKDAFLRFQELMKKKNGRMGII